MRSVAEHEAHATIDPPVELSRQGEVGIHVACPLWVPKTPYRTPSGEKGSLRGLRRSLVTLRTQESGKTDAAPSRFGEGAHASVTRRCRPLDGAGEPRLRSHQLAPAGDQASPQNYQGRVPIPVRTQGPMTVVGRTLIQEAR